MSPHLSCVCLSMFCRVNLHRKNLNHREKIFGSTLMCTITSHAYLRNLNLNIFLFFFCLEWARCSSSPTSLIRQNLMLNDTNMAKILSQWLDLMLSFARVLCYFKSIFLLPREQHSTVNIWWERMLWYD